MALPDVLVPALKAAFPDRGLTVGVPPKPLAVFPAACAEVGEVRIFDDHGEALVEIGTMTHGHFYPYGYDFGKEDRERWITQEVVWFLEKLFADEVLLYVNRVGPRGGGWRFPFREIPEDLPAEAELFVWSRRVRPLS